MKLNVAFLCLTATASSVSAFQLFPAPCSTTSVSTNHRTPKSASSCRVGNTAFFMSSPPSSSPSSSSSDQAEGSSSTKAVIIKRLPNSAVEIAIPVPGQATQAAYDKVLFEVSKNVQIPGFRKGSRIPPAVLEQTMAGGKNALKVQAINELLKKLVEPALKEQELDAIGQPVLQVPAEELALEFTPGQELTLAVKCDVWPEIQWKTVEGKEKPYTGLNGKYKRKPFNAVKLNQALSDLKERYATLEPITDPEHVLKTGDACVVNMQGYMADADGNKAEPLPNAASGDRVEVILGPGRYMEGLVEGLEGAKIGQTVSVKVNFPDKLRDKALAGKSAIFDVEVLEASARSVPEMTDEFAAQVRAGLTAESIMSELRKAVDEEDSREFVGARNKALGDALATVMDVDVPDTLITNQAREKYAVMMAEMRDSGVSDDEIKNQISPENFLKYKDIVREDIVRDFKVSMATDEIARMEGVQVAAFQVEEQMESIRKDAAERKEEFDETMVRGKVETTLQRQGVMDWLADNSNLEVEFIEESFDENMMQQLADESVKREEALAAENAAATASEQGKATPVEVEVQSVVKEPAQTASSTVEDAVIEAEPVAKEPPVVKEPVAEEPEDEASKTERYANMSVEERAFQILVDTGGFELNKDPDDPDYDSSQDNEYA